MTATVDGTAFTAQCVSGSFATGSGYQFTGVESGSATTARTISFVIRTTGGPATFGAGTDVVTGSVAIGTSLWGWAWSPTGSSSNAGTGTIVATTLSPTTGGAGTFSFTAIATTGSATGTKMVTNGTFNVVF